MCTIIMQMYIVIFVWLCTAIYFIHSAACMYTTINTRQHQVIFHYSKEHRSEKDLPLCEENEVCSVLHKRYWLSPMADRLCRCSQNGECPWKWSNDTDIYTMFLNNRSQLKFCTPVRNLKTCTAKQTALTVTTSTANNSTKLRNSVSAFCSCSEDHYWKHQGTSTGTDSLKNVTHSNNDYRCTKLKKCQSMEFCGNVRIDQNSIFYRCSCPKGHLCIQRDRMKYAVEELLYKGYAYKATCELFDKNNYYDY